MGELDDRVRRAWAAHDSRLDYLFPRRMNRRIKTVNLNTKNRTVTVWLKLKGK